MGVVSKPSTWKFVTTEEDEGRRLDQVLAANIPELSRTRARVLLDIGGVFVDGTRVKTAGRTMRRGQTVWAHYGGALARAASGVGKRARARDKAFLPAFQIVYEDGDVVVVDKPAGLLTAPTPESDRNNLADLLERRSEPKSRIFVVHRLDLHTSGLIMFAKNRNANRILGEALRLRKVHRKYRVAVQGIVSCMAKTIRTAVQGKSATTHFRVERKVGEHFTLLIAQLETGRTHQIRIHAREWGHPVLGDLRYGGRTVSDPPRMALHAAELGFDHPLSNKWLEFACEWPADLSQWLDSFTHFPNQL